jgi:filamentous hemagglutinin family protein
MSNVLNGLIRRVLTVSSALFSWQLCQHSACANPTGGTVGQGTASFNTSGSQETIITSANAYINWQSFNIAAGETTTFVQPSSSSVVWNSIGGGSASQILGNLNANGYVILQNQSGFYVGGQASITAHGLIMTTASAAPNLSSGGSWDFDSPPPTAEIINYGQINTVGGGSAFLIADNIENNGTISAPSGNIGLYAGEQVLVSMSPDGRGLSAAVTLPQGSVDNQGNLIADGGAIAAQAQTVNQNGLIQANSVQNVNGTIELVASDSLNVGANSVISANGDSTASSASPGGFVVLQSGNTYADTPTSTINVTGQNGGQNGIVEIFGANLAANPVQSVIGNVFALLENPYDLTLSSNPTSSSPSSQASDEDYSFNVADLAAYSQIDLHALDNIELSTPVSWSLNNSSEPASLSLSAGNNILLDDGAGISAGNDWSVNLSAGNGFVPTTAQPAPTSGSDGIYLNGSAYIQTMNGNISISAVNEVQVGYGGFSDQDGSSGIRTLDGGLDGGNINVTTQYGDVNAGANSDGYIYSGNAPYYTVSQSVGGISTVNGGNVSIAAGGNVISYLPGTSEISDAGSGAFGSNPGNVTITAGGSVYGHYVVADGTGIITAGANVGGPGGADGFALSLISGTWNVNALSGDIYLQEVNNPNGDFNDLEGGTRGHLNTAGRYWFNYSPDAAVNLDAVGVYLTDLNIPQLNPNIPVLYPPILNITAGAGGVTLEGDVTLFPSVDQSLMINILDGGDLIGIPANAGTSSSQNPELLMSDSPGTQWTAINNFGDSDLGYANAVEPAGLTTGLNPVVINVSGNMENLTLTTTKETQITVGGNMIDCAFSGQNLQAGDTTFLTVGGQISNPGVYTYVDDVIIPSVPVNDLLPGMGLSWDDIFILALNPSIIDTLTLPPNILQSQWLSYAIGTASLFGTTRTSGGEWAANDGDQGFTYSSTTSQLGYAGPMSSSLLSLLSGPITILKLVNGQPVLNANGTFETQTIDWAAPSAVQTLFTDSQSDVPIQAAGSSYYLVGGPGQFDVTAGSISLGSSEGIISCGAEDPFGSIGDDRYQNLASITPEGATVNVTVANDLNMLTSTIATLGGGDVNLSSTGGSLDLGVEGIANEERQVGYGVFTAGPGDVNVTAFGDINIDGSRIAAYDGGNIVVESDTGNVNVGSAGDTFSGVLVTYVNPVTGLPATYPEDVYGSGILAVTLQPPQPGYYLPPDTATVPGNITVETPQGDITASLGGITQEALNGSIAGGPTVTLIAGTPASGTAGQAGYSPGYVGNIDLGQSGVIGGTVNATANGNISGLIISRQNSNVSAAQNFSGSVISGGSADVGAGGSVSGVIVGVGGASVSGGSVSAQVISQNANVNGASSDSLGSSAAATSASQAASQQANSTAQQQVADNSADDSNDTDDKKKKKPALLQHIKRVTVILPKSV